MHRRVRTAAQKTTAMKETTASHRSSEAPRADPPDSPTPSPARTRLGLSFFTLACLNLPPSCATPNIRPRSTSKGPLRPHSAPRSAPFSATAPGPSARAPDGRTDGDLVSRRSRASRRTRRPDPRDHGACPSLNRCGTRRPRRTSGGRARRERGGGGGRKRRARATELRGAQASRWGRGEAEGGRRCREWERGRLRQQRTREGFPLSRVLPSRGLMSRRCAPFLGSTAAQRPKRRSSAHTLIFPFVCSHSRRLLALPRRFFSFPPPARLPIVLVFPLHHSHPTDPLWAGRLGRVRPLSSAPDAPVRVACGRSKTLRTRLEPYSRPRLGGQSPFPATSSAPSSSAVSPDTHDLLSFASIPALSEADASRFGHLVLCHTSRGWYRSRTAASPRNPDPQSQSPSGTAANRCALRAAPRARPRRAASRRGPPLCAPRAACDRAPRPHQDAPRRSPIRTCPALGLLHCRDARPLAPRAPCDPRGRARGGPRAQAEQR